jgi:hypothetical protein
MAPRRVVYTVQIGAYERLLPHYVAAGSAVDFVCFTDQPDLNETGWQMRPADVRFPEDPNRSSRRAKLLPHEYLDDYEESLYIDNTVLLTKPPDQIFDELLPDGAGMAVLRHSSRANLRDEFKAVVKHGYEAPWVCDEQQGHYERSYAAALEAKPLWGGLILRRHNEPLVRETMQIWWEHVLRYSRRDQLSLPIALEVTGMKPIVHQLDNELSGYHEWPRGAAHRKKSWNPVPPGPADRIRELEAQCNELAEQVQNIRDNVRQEEERRRHYALKVQRSRSWRITAPLRWLGRFARMACRGPSRS